MWLIGDALLLDRDFIALMLSSFENKINENEFFWVSYFSLIFITVSLFFIKSVILDRDWPSKFECFVNFKVFEMSPK